METMFNLSNQNEVTAAERLIRSGLAMAKQSFEQILQHKISIKEIDYGKGFLEKLATGNEDFYVIKTELKGQVEGTNLLILRESEVNQIYQACLPASVVADSSPAGEQMRMGFLSEIDNMVAAAVITEFANFLGLDIFGHVPDLRIVKSEELMDFIETELVSLNPMVHFKAIFHSDELDISPDFLWIFQDQLLNQIRQAI